MATPFDVLTLVVENVLELSITSVLLAVAVRPELLARVTRVKFGDLEVELQDLKEKVDRSEKALAERGEEIEALQNDLSLEREALTQALAGIDLHAPVRDLQPAVADLKAQARAQTDFDAVREVLRSSTDPAELLAAAVALRERRPPAALPDLTVCLGRLADDPDLHGVRLYIVWMLTSALHRTLIAAIRDHVQPQPSPADYQDTLATLDRLEAHPRVQGDRPDNPKQGIRGPLGYSRTWIERALQR